jgi:hypothetical protein
MPDPATTIKVINMPVDTVIDGTEATLVVSSAGENKKATLNSLKPLFATDLSGVEADIVTAQTTADTALGVAGQADGKADQAITDAGTAQSTANTALANASTADGKAVNAQSTANTAIANAGTAQSTANQAITDAGTAQAGVNNHEIRITALEQEDTVIDFLKKGNFSSGITQSPSTYNSNPLTSAIITPITDGSSKQFIVPAGYECWFRETPDVVYTTTQFTVDIVDPSQSNHYIYFYLNAGVVNVGQRTRLSEPSEDMNEIWLGTITSDPSLVNQGIIRNSSGNPKVVDHINEVERLKYIGSRVLMRGSLVKYAGGSPAGLHITANEGWYSRFASGFVFGHDYMEEEVSNTKGLIHTVNNPLILGGSANSRIYTQRRDGFKMPQRSGNNATLDFAIAPSTTKYHAYEATSGVITQVTASLNSQFVAYWIGIFPKSGLMYELLGNQVWGTLDGAKTASLVNDGLEIPSEVKEGVLLYFVAIRCNQTAWTGSPVTDYYVKYLQSVS